MMSRNPTPTALRKIRGNPGKRKMPDEPEVPGDLSTPPRHLNAVQKAAWTYAIENAPRGLLRKIDRTMLAAWVVAESLHYEATRLQNMAPLVRQVGPLPRGWKEGDPDNRPLQIIPLIKIINQQALVMIRIASELGFSPTSRARIYAKPQDDDFPPEDVGLDAPSDGPSLQSFLLRKPGVRVPKDKMN